MLKTGITTSGYEKTFIREAINHGTRLDGRRWDEFRNIQMNIKKTETSTLCEVSIGSTMVVSEIIGKIAEPFPDKPDEGFLYFHTDILATTDCYTINTTHSDISRALERIIRDSKALDTDSLCIVSGEKVWEIHCEVKVLDGSGGNILDTAVLSAMGGLKSFRKSEISVLQTELVNQTQTRSQIQIFHSDDRDPLPLALYHTPLSLTLGIFRKSVSSKSSQSVGGSGKYIFIIDPCLEEESVMDGSITFSLNTYKELCAVNKPGGIPLDVASIMEAAQLAMKRISQLHDTLNASLNDLEGQTLLEREERRERLRLYQLKLEEVKAMEKGSNMEIEEVTNAQKQMQSVGIDRNDPILDWSNLHHPVAVRES